MEIKLVISICFCNVSVFLTINFQSNLELKKGYFMLKFLSSKEANTQSSFICLKTDFPSLEEGKELYFMSIPHENAKFELSYDENSIAFVNVLKKWKYNSSYNEKTKREYFKFLCNILGIRDLEKAKEGHRHFKFSKVYELLFVVLLKRIDVNDSALSQIMNKRTENIKIHSLIADRKALINMVNEQYKTEEQKQMAEYIIFELFSEVDFIEKEFSSIHHHLTSKG